VRKSRPSEKNWLKNQREFFQIIRPFYREIIKSENKKPRVSFSLTGALEKEKVRDGVHKLPSRTGRDSSV